MKDRNKRATRRMGWLGLSVLLASMPFLAGCAGAIALPALMAGTYAAADIIYMPLRSIVGTVLLSIINGLP